MILPIHVYGDPVLRDEAQDVDALTPELTRLFADMHETMRNADGIGLAAPQVGRSERVFVVDVTPLVENGKLDGAEVPPQPMVFVNPEITWESDVETDYEEGCLSIPDIREKVWRPDAVRVTYRDADFAEQELLAEGMLAPVIQHELDHLDGVLFLDHISAFRRRMLQRRLRDMAAGNVDAEYPLAVA